MSSVGRGMTTMESSAECVMVFRDARTSMTGVVVSIHPQAAL